MKHSENSADSTLKLWNPNAAANWSLLFSPILGAWLQAKNWEALDEKDKAKKSMLWVYSGFALFFASLIGVFFLPDDVGTGPGLIFLFAWYFYSGKKQAQYFKENDIRYQKRSWIKPLLIGCGGIVAYLAVAVSFSIALAPTLTKTLEKESVDLVTQIVQGQLGGKATCKAVSITKNVSDGFYQAIAYLDDGTELKVVIELKGDQILVTVPKQ